MTVVTRCPKDIGGDIELKLRAAAVTVTAALRWQVRCNVSPRRPEKNSNVDGPLAACQV